VPSTVDFQAVLDASPNPYMLLDRELRYVWANAAYARVTSSKVDDLIGRHLLDVFPNDPHDPDNDQARRLRESFERVIATGASDTLAFIPYRIERPTPGGPVLEERYWSATHTPIVGDDGEVAFVLQHTVDVTELHQLRQAAQPPDAQDDTSQIEAGVLQRAQRVEEKSITLDEERRHLRRLFEQAPGFMVFLRGSDHVVELANHAYLQLIGHREIVGKTVRAALPELEGQGFYELLDRVYASGETYVGRGVRTLLQRHPGADLDEVFLDFVYQPIVDPRGTVTGIFVQGHDMTQQKRLEMLRERLLEREQAARADAEHANRLKDEFLATLSHELRTPLNALLGWARILRTTPMDAAGQQRALDVIERNAAVQTQLVQDILDVSSIITGKLRLNVRSLDIGDVISAAIDTVKPAAEAKGVSIRHTGVRSASASGDAERLQQVVWNLLANAVKFTPAGGAVQVALADGHDGVQLTITDSGIGIAPELLPHVFERFRQGESGGERGHRGLGLGLSIVKHVVEAHGGSVEASSGGRGHGATFTIRLPRRAVGPQEGKIVSHA
jgi:PAS domain S-box-containing protein